MSESLFATRTSLFVETAPRTGSPSGDVVEAPFSDAAVARRVTKFDEKKSPFRHSLGRFPLHEFFELRSSHDVGLDFLAFLIEPHLRGGTKLDHSSPDPTFALEVESEGGDRFVFKGLAIRELQVSLVARGIVTIEVSWVGLIRDALETNLTAATLNLSEELIAGRQCDVVSKAGNLIDRATDAGNARTAEIFLTRDLEASQYEADGRPRRHSRGPWRVIGEVVIPADDFAEDSTLAFVDGSAAFYLGEDGSDLQFLLDGSVRWLSDSDPIKADDFRDKRVIFEAEPDSSGALFTFSKNL